MVALARRTGLVFAVLLGFMIAVSAAEQGAYPSRSITLIVPFAVGGSTDAIGRIVAEGLSEVLGQAVVVDNRAGAGGSIGTEMLARARPDGYTIGIGTASTLAINPTAYRTLPFDVLVDLAPIGKIAAVPNVMSVHPGVPAATVTELVTLVRAQPGKLSYGSPGQGSVSHLLGEQFKLATGTDIVHVAYPGMGPALAEAVKGHIQVVYDNLPTSLALIRVGKLRALAVSGTERSRSLPEVPTFGELGLHDLNWMGFFGLMAPGGTPPAIVQHLSAALSRVLAMPHVLGALGAQEAVEIDGSPEAFRDEIERELMRMRGAVEAAKISVE